MTGASPAIVALPPPPARANPQSRPSYFSQPDDQLPLDPLQKRRKQRRLDQCPNPEQSNLLHPNQRSRLAPRRPHAKQKSKTEVEAQALLNPTKFGNVLDHIRPMAPEHEIGSDRRVDAAVKHCPAAAEHITKSYVAALCGTRGDQWLRETNGPFMAYHCSGALCPEWHGAFDVSVSSSFAQAAPGRCNAAGGDLGGSAYRAGPSAPWRRGLQPFRNAPLTPRGRVGGRSTPGHRPTSLLSSHPS